jgi:hypothetical protein
LLAKNDEDDTITNDGEFAKMLSSFDAKDRADFFKIAKENYMRKNK